MVRIWSGKEAIFSRKLQRTQGRERKEGKNCRDMDHDHDMLEVYNFQLRTLGSSQIFSDLLNKIFSLQYIFSPLHISDKLVSITSFKASPVSLLDVSSSKEKAAARAHCAGQYLVSGAGDIIRASNVRQPIRAKTPH